MITCKTCHNLVWNPDPDVQKFQCLVNLPLNEDLSMPELCRQLKDYVGPLIL